MLEILPATTSCGDDTKVHTIQQQQPNRFWSTKKRRTYPFKHKHCQFLLLLFLLLAPCLATGGDVLVSPGPSLRRPLPVTLPVVGASPTAAAAAPPSSRRIHLSQLAQHHARPNTEYFYANDKLADDQVASFVSSLQNGSNSQNSNRPSSSSSASIGLPAGASAGGQSAIRSSQYAASSVFPASLVSRATVLSAQSSFTSSSSSSSSSSPSTELSSSKPFSSSSFSSSYFPPSSSSSSSSSTSTSSNEGANNNNNLPNSLTRQASSAKQQQPSNSQPSSINGSVGQQQQRNHSTRSSSSHHPEFDLSWVQPVYVAKKRLNNNTSTTTTTEPKLQLNAFKADPTINLFPVPSTNRTFNRTMLDNLEDESSSSTSSTTNSNSELHNLEDRLEAFSAALANMTFSLREEQWVAPIIALSLLNIMVILGFECFVIYRACRTCPSRRHLFLGQMLLLGLFLSSVMGIAFVPSSNWLTCTLIRAGLGVCFAIVYGTLLVKAVFLLSLHSGVYLSAEYQALLLFFIISTQVAIDVQWLLHRSSSIVIDYMDGYGHAVYKCDHSINQLLLSLLYVMILIVLIAIMAFRVRGYRENHGEALFLGITATATILLWLVWIAGTITSTPHYRDGFVAFGLVCNATLIFIIMFLPKGRQLAAVGREGGGGPNHHLDDRDQLSTASSPSIYTPSFLHIKSPVSQLIPLGKPSIAGLSSVVSGNGGLSSVVGNGGLNGGSHLGGGGYHHLYKQFQGTGTTLTSPMSTTGGPPPTSALTSSAIPNSYSSHALFSLAKNNSNSNHDHEDDPNYSNLSNVFTSIAGGGNNHLHSPISENNSSSTGGGGGGGGGGGSSQNSKSSSSGGSGSKAGSKSSQNSSSKSSGGGSSSHHSHSHMVKSASGTANADGFFYLQPPPLPPPSGRPPAPPGTNNGGSGAQQQQQQNSRPWRQTCYTPNYHRATSGGGVGLSHYGGGGHKSTLGNGSGNGGGSGLYGGGSGSHHHNTNNHHHHSYHQGADHVRTPMGPPPSGVNSLHHHLLSPSSDNETTSFYFASFDAASSTTRQLLADRERGVSGGGGAGGGGGGHNVGSNFKYFRGPLY